MTLTVTVDVGLGCEWRDTIVFFYDLLFCNPESFRMAAVLEGCWRGARHGRTGRVMGSAKSASIFGFEILMDWS